MYRAARTRIKSKTSSEKESCRSVYTGAKGSLLLQNSKGMPKVALRKLIPFIATVLAKPAIEDPHLFIYSRLLFGSQRCISCGVLDITLAAPCKHPCHLVFNLFFIQDKSGDVADLH
jgi:hypothetical protein